MNVSCETLILGPWKPGTPPRVPPRVPPGSPPVPPRDPPQDPPPGVPWGRVGKGFHPFTALTTLQCRNDLPNDFWCLTNNLLSDKYPPIVTGRPSKLDLCYRNRLSLSHKPTGSADLKAPPLPPARYPVFWTLLKCVANKFSGGPLPSHCEATKLPS